MASTPSSPMNSYIRVSCAYAVSHALNANRSAAYTPVRVPNSFQPAQPPAGIVSTPHTSDSEWVAVSELPKTDIQTCSIM